MHTWSAHTGWSVVGLGVFDCDVRCHPSIPPFGARARDGPEVEFMSRVLVGVRLCSPLRLPSPSCNFLITSHRCSAALPTENCIARCSRSAALAATVVLGASLLGTQPAMSYEVEVLDVSAAPLSSRSSSRCRFLRRAQKRSPAAATHIATRALPLCIQARRRLPHHL
jgi:hypothetical protein